MAKTKPVIKNSQVLGFASWLNELELNGRQSRERSRVVKILAEKIREIEKFRLEILEKYSQKDKKGKSKVGKDNKMVLLDDKKKEQFVTEVTELYNEEFELAIDDFQIDVLKNIVLDTTYLFGPKEGDSEPEKAAKIRQANDYVLWCEMVEKCG